MRGNVGGDVLLVASPARRHEQGRDHADHDDDRAISGFILPKTFISHLPSGRGGRFAIQVSNQGPVPSVFAKTR